MLTVRPIKKVRVWSRNPEHAKRFADRESAHADSCIEVAHSAQEAVLGSDIVCTTTGSTSPILLGKWLNSGTHVNAIGASVSPFREINSEAVKRSRLFVDSRESVLKEVEDIKIPLKEGVILAKHVKGELGEILSGKVEGRISTKDITLFKSVGLAVEDLAAAHYIYNKANDRNAGTWVQLFAERATIE
jgi:alanine dehydrogenase